MSKYIKLEEITGMLEKVIKHGVPDRDGKHSLSAEVILSVINGMEPAYVKPVMPIIDRIEEERKRAKGNWHTDPYWRGWVDAMRRAQRIVDGTIDDEPVYATSYATCNEDKREAEK